jgi:hypothetical protein
VEQGRRVGNAFPHLGGQVISSRIISPAQGIFKGKCVGRTMAFEHQSLQTQQGSAVVAAVIHLVFKRR